MTHGDVLQALEEARVTHLVGLPDNTSGPLLAGRSGPRRVAVTREGEAFAVASGLWIGGAAPVVVIQNTGLLESGDALRGTAVRMGIPLPCLVTFRGWQTLGSGSPADSTLLLDPAVDSVALLTEPTLCAWGVPWKHLTEAADVVQLVERSRERSFPEIGLIDALRESR